MISSISFFKSTSPVDEAGRFPLQHQSGGELRQLAVLEVAGGVTNVDLAFAVVRGGPGLAAPLRSLDVLAETVIGPLIQPETGEFVDRQIEDACGKGARMLTGGPKMPGTLWRERGGYGFRNSWKNSQNCRAAGLRRAWRRRIRESSLVTASVRGRMTTRVFAM